MNRWGVELAWREHNQSYESKYEMKALGDICQTGTGGTPSRKRREFFGGGIPWVKSGEVRNNIITTTEETLSEGGLANCQARLFPAGSIIIAMYGQGATRGRTAKLGIKATTNQVCLVMTDFSDRVLADFVWFYLTARYDEIRGLASGNNQPNLSAKLIRAVPVPLPPLPVQRELVAQVTKQRQKIATLRAEADRKAETAMAEIEAMVLGVKPVNA